MPKHLSLGVVSAATTTEFRALCPAHPTPWTQDILVAAATVLILDANGALVIEVKRDALEDALWVAGAIVVAINTCAGEQMEES